MDRYLEFILNHYILTLAFAVVSFLVIQDILEAVLRKFEVISPLLAVTKMNTVDTVILDVREEHEFIKGHIEDAVHIPLGKLENQLNKLSNAKDKPIIAVCQTGTRSSVACRTLNKNGFKQVFSLTGGMQSWEDNKLPIKITAKNKD